MTERNRDELTQQKQALRAKVRARRRQFTTSSRAAAASVSMADELSDVYTELDESKGGETVPTGDGGLQLEAMETLAARLENIAASLESN